jgi:hypothetical protein
MSALSFQTFLFLIDFAQSCVVIICCNIMNFPITTISWASGISLFHEHYDLGSHGSVRGLKCQSPTRRHCRLMKTTNYFHMTL